MDSNIRACVEYGFRARANKDSIRHQKKCEEFLKAIKGLTDIELIKSKYRETLVKSNCVKEEDDYFFKHLILDQETINEKAQ